METLRSVSLIITLVQGILGLWILLKAYQVSLGWFLFLLPLYLGAGVLWAEALGPILGAAIVLGGTLLFVVSH